MASAPRPRPRGPPHVRCWPPSSAIICPVIDGVSRMKRTAAAISAGVGPRFRSVDAHLGGEVALRLMHALQDRSRADGVDAHARCHRLRQRLRRGPQAGFGDRVGEEVRRRPPHPLVDDVDDVACRALRQVGVERLGEKHRRLQIDVEVRVPVSVDVTDAMVSRKNSEALLTRQVGAPSASRAAGDQRRERRRARRDWRGAPPPCRRRRRSRAASAWASSRERR